MASSAPSNMRVLCFGASITGGFHTFGLAKHPYSLQLKSNLQRDLPNTQLDVSVDSVSGDVVVGGSYIRRLEAQMTPNNQARFDWVIVQGGGNDLGRGEDAQIVFESLKQIWDVALASGAKVLALTVTETASPSSQVRMRYNALNQMILQDNTKGLYVCDVAKEIPYHAMAQEQRAKIWDDGLHFKPAGYDLMGNVITDRLRAILFGTTISKI